MSELLGYLLFIVFLYSIFVIEIFGEISQTPRLMLTFEVLAVSEDIKELKGENKTIPNKVMIQNPKNRFFLLL